MQKKNGISLIVLVITIIVMIILAAAVVLTLNNTGILKRANEAVDKTNIKEVQNLASVIWAEEYLEDKRGDTLKEAVLGRLEDYTGKYNIDVTDKGVMVTKKEETLDDLNQGAAGLYESGSNYTKMITSWKALLDSEMVTIIDGNLVRGAKLPEDIPQMNEYGFYFDVIYTTMQNGETLGIKFNEDTSIESYQNGVHQGTVPAGYFSYSKGAIDMSAVGWGIGKVSPKGGTILFSDNELTLTLGERLEIKGDLLLPKDGSVIKIISGVFSECETLTGIIIPNSVEYIGKDVFYECTNLEHVIFDDNSKLTIIDSGVFEECTSLTNIDIPDSVIDIKYDSFAGSIGVIKIEDGIKYVDDWVVGFEDGIKEAKVLDFAKKIASLAFANCDTLESVNLHNDVKIICYAAFENCTNLETINIPASLEMMANGAFRKSGLTSITFEEGCKITQIESQTFWGCSNLESVEIPGNVTKITQEAFRNCNNLKNVYFEGKVESFINIEYTNEYAHPCQYGANLYVDGKLLETLVIPDGVETIKRCTFYGCESIKSIILPLSVKKIEVDSFYGASNIQSLYYNGTLEQWCNINIMQPFAFRNIYIQNKKIEGELIIPSGITCIGSHTFYGLKDITSLTLPEGVIETGSYTFSDCVNLTTINLPSTITKIGFQSFADCTNLTTINYAGTTTQWKDGTITFGSYWNYYAGNYTVYCSDGTVAKDGTVTLN